MPTILSAPPLTSVLVRRGERHRERFTGRGNNAGSSLKLELDLDQIPIPIDLFIHSMNFTEDF
ncbi:hypothetical protein ACEYXF_42890 [Streptomyces asiaticus]|uniref:hypothetical protein n=1 Tax=Streptomyces asiaticus TaxID=114695 RepID=UPI0039BECBAB